MRRFLRAADLPLVHALLDALIAHEDGALPDPRTIGAVEAIERQLVRLPREDALLLRALLVLIEWAPLARHGRRFSRLDLGRRRAFFEGWATSRLLPLRAAYAALKALVMISYWTRPAAWPAIGYDGPWVGRVAVEVIAVPRPPGSEGPPP